MSKVIARFDPTPARSLEECERHYQAAHVPFAQDQLRQMPALLSYHTNRAVAQADVAGGFTQRPRAWRFVVLRFTPGENLAFTPHQNEVVSQDHTNCLFRLRSCTVEETVAVDRREGQLALAKFVVEVDRPEDADAGAAHAGFDRLCDRLGSAMESAFGARLMLANRVTEEVEAEPVEFEGQRAIGMLAATTKVGYVECYFDHPRWGRETLGPLAAGGGLWDDAYAPPSVYEVEEQAALDLTGMRG